jgi:hypothetical protein
MTAWRCAPDPGSWIGGGGGGEFCSKRRGTWKLCSRVLACCLDQFGRGMLTLGVL